MTSLPRVRSWAALLALLSLAAVAGADSTLQEDRLRQDIAFARDRVYPALVNISVVTKQFSGGRVVRFPSAGSGVIVTPEGHVLTNFHVAEDAARLTCALPSGEKIDADVVTHDPLTDLSVLKLKVEERKDPSKPLPVATIGDSSLLEVGEPVLAMGNPRTNSNTVTLGIVANANRVFKSFTGTSIEIQELGAGQTTGLFTNWIQHDALIQQGNSGGPLVNLRGEVVGINELGGGGMGFAIPSNLAKQVLAQAIEHGEVRRGWVGVTVHPVEPLERKDGALVASVLEDGPAAKAGLRPGDVVLEVGGEKVSVLTFEDVPGFYARVAALPIDQEVPVAWVRGEETHRAAVSVARMQPSVGEQRAFEGLGISGMAITGPMAVARRYPDTRGVVVTGMRPGYPPELAKPSIEPGDVLLKIGQCEIDGLDALAAAETTCARIKDVLVRFRRGKRDMVTVLDMTKKPEDRRSHELPKPWLGVQTQVLTVDVAKALGHPGQKGYRVTRVLRGSPAEKAGFQAGDLLVTLDGSPLQASQDPQDAELLRRAIEDMDVGAVVKVGVIRDSETIEVQATLEESPETATDAKKAEDTRLEYKVREVTYTDRVDRDWPLDQQGVVVADVQTGGWANVAGLQAGDLILAIDDRPVTSIEDFERETARVASEKPKRVKIFVRRGVSTAFVFVAPDWPR